MGNDRKIKLCLGVILVLICAQGGLLVAAEMSNPELVRQLRADIDLILVSSGAIMTALVTTVGILWGALRSSQREFIQTLKRIKREAP